jgi:hypothetical protein
MFSMLLLSFFVTGPVPMWNLACHSKKRTEIKAVQEQITFQHEFMLLMLRVYPSLPSEHCFMLTALKILYDEVGPISTTSAPPDKGIKSLVT